MADFSEILIAASYIHTELESKGIEYCIVGGTAAYRHNVVRPIRDLDILISEATFKNLPLHALRHVETYLGNRKFSVSIDYIHEGGREAYPNPALCRERVCGLWFIDLKSLIRLKKESPRDKDQEDHKKLLANNYGVY